MSNVSNDDPPRNADQLQSETPDRAEETQIVEDGGIESTLTIYESARQSARTWLSSPTQNLRKRGESLDRIEVLLGCLFGSSILGVLVGLTMSISPAVLTSFGIGIFFLTLLVLAVILLQQASAEQEPSSSSWSQQNRPAIRRRP